MVTAARYDGGMTETLPAITPGTLIHYGRTTWCVTESGETFTHGTGYVWATNQLGREVVILVHVNEQGRIDRAATRNLPWVDVTCTTRDSAWM